MTEIQTPQEFLLSIYGMKILDAEMALVRYVQAQRDDATGTKDCGSEQPHVYEEVNGVNKCKFCGKEYHGFLPE